MTSRGHRLLFLVMFAATPLFAQSQDDRIQQMERKVDDLVRQAAELRQEIDQLKGGVAAAQPVETEDLTKIDVAPAPAAAPQPAPSVSTPSLTEVQTVNNPVNVGASKVFNPDISVIGNFFGKAGQQNPFEFGPDRDSMRPALQLEEAELSFQAFVDPYAKAAFFLSAGPGGLEIEEGYAQFVALPFDLTAKAGKFKALFGKANTWHTHVRPWVDQPLVIHNFFGDEQLADNGVSVSKVFPNSANIFLEASGEVFRGDVENVFQHDNLNDLFYNAHLKAFRDITEDSNLEVGTSYARGSLGNARNQFGGVDVTYRWKPLRQGLYRGFIGRLEAVSNDRPDAARNLKGFYASGDYQLGQRWFTGLRIDGADRFLDGGSIVTDRGAAATLTFWPSEFSQVRGELRRIRYGNAETVNEFLFQLQFAIGAHGAHSF
ncbi:MAG: bZIP transcription factor [Thermoanaerobaculia bacterium]